MNEDSNYLRWLINESLADSLEQMVSYLKNHDNSGDDVMNAFELLIEELRKTNGEH